MKMASFKTKRLILVLLAVAFVFVIAFFASRNRQPPEQSKVQNGRPLYPLELGSKFPCPGKTETVNWSDPYLPGKIEPGQKVKVIWNWYACHAPVAGEIALVRVSRDLPPKAKLIRAVPGDTLAVKQGLAAETSQERWNLFVNGQPVLDYQNAKYSFGGNALPPIGRYIEVQGAVLGPRDVIVLSTRSPGEFDSGAFGVMGVSDLVAKIELQ